MTHTKPKGKKADRTALVRIIIVLLEALGLLRIDKNKATITDAGLDLIAAEGDKLENVIQAQVAKYQYPNPLMSVPYIEEYKGILPHLFLLQVIQESNYEISFVEFDLFVNLASDQKDVQRIVNYIRHWRSLNREERDELLEIVKQVPIFEEQATQADMFDDGEEHTTRYSRVAKSSSYQRAFFSFSNLLKIQEDKIVCVAKPQIDMVIKNFVENLKISIFETPDDWIAYHGDPLQQPSWFTFLANQLEQAEDGKDVQKLVEENLDKLSNEEKIEIRQRQIEKDIETFYVGQLSLLEKGLKLAAIDGRPGRQFPTPIGRIDLLCVDKEDNYVVVEVKADEASDSVFGQILRYMGWVYWNLEGGKSKVRGIVLASRFAETARYSRIGLQRKDHAEFLKFKEHGLNVSDS